MHTVKRFGGSLFSLLAFQYMYAQLFTNAFYRHLETAHQELYQNVMASLSATMNQHLGINSFIHTMNKNPAYRADESLAPCRSFIQPGADFLTQHTTDMQTCMKKTLESFIDMDDAVMKQQILQQHTYSYNFLIRRLEDFMKRLEIPSAGLLKFNYDTGAKTLPASQRYIFQLVKTLNRHQKTIEQKILTVPPTFSSTLNSLASAYIENRWLVAGALAATTLVSYLAYRSITACEKTKKPEVDSTETSLTSSVIHYFCMSLPLLLIGYSLYALSDTPDESSLNHIVFAQLAAASMLLTSVFATTTSHISNRLFKAKQQKILNDTQTELQSHGLETKITMHITDKGQPTNTVNIKLLSLNGKPLTNSFVKRVAIHCKKNNAELRRKIPTACNNTLTINIGMLKLITPLIIEHTNKPAEEAMPRQQLHIAETARRHTVPIRKKLTGAARARRTASLFPTPEIPATTTETQPHGRLPASFRFTQGTHTYTAYHVEGTINMYVAFTLQAKNHHEKAKVAAFRTAVESTPRMGTSIMPLKSSDPAIEIRTTGTSSDYRCICRAQSTTIPGHPDAGHVPLYISEEIVRHAALGRATATKSLGR